jgi:hypothetical protein
MILLGWVKLLGEEFKGLPGVVDTMLQHGTHGGSGSACDEAGSGCANSGACQTRLPPFKGPVEIRRPSDWMNLGQERVSGSGDWAAYKSSACPRSDGADWRS